MLLRSGNNEVSILRLSDLAAYAQEKYNMKEQFKWTDFPGYSVLADSFSGKWVALLMRRFDRDLGEEVELCDIKCGREILSGEHEPFLTESFRMHGPKWVGVTFDMTTDDSVVKKLFDSAVAMGKPKDFTITLDEKGSVIPTSFLRPASELTPKHASADEDIPEKIREMIRLYDYRDGSFRQKCLNFYRQGKLMEDYTDAAPWLGDLRRSFPTYHDLNLKQLRGYFTWRTHLREGKYEKTCSTFVYLYIYELLNGIGASSGEETLEKMAAFQKNYIDAGMGDQFLRSDIRKWMREFSVIHGFPEETTLRYMDPVLLEHEQKVSVLWHPEAHMDAEIYGALLRFYPKAADSSAVTKGGDRGKSLFAEVWRRTSGSVVHADNELIDGKDLFTACFGSARSKPWFPLANAVYYSEHVHEDTVYQLGMRKYICKDGSWQEEKIESITADRTAFQYFMHAADLKIRKYLGTGHPLKEKKEEAWAYAIIDTALAEIRREEIEASRPKISIDLSGLDRIREDAGITRDSLLTEDEIYDGADDDAVSDAADILSPQDAAIVRSLLNGGYPTEIISENHLMPQVVAARINEALFDDVGDSVIECEDDRLSLVEDYIDDITLLIGEAE